MLRRRGVDGGMSSDYMFLYIGIYDSVDDAEADYKGIRALHHERLIGTYDVAIVVKDASGAVKVHQHEKPTQRGGWLGLVAGGLVGLLFPATLVAMAIGAGSGTALGAMVAHLARGVSRGDLKELGEQLDEGEVALFLVAKDKIDTDLEKVLAKSSKRIEKALSIDEPTFQNEVERAFDDMVGQ